MSAPKKTQDDEICWSWVVDDEGVAIKRADRAIHQALEARKGEWRTAGGEALLSPPPPLSRTQIQRLIDDGRVTLDARPTQANSPLVSGSRIELRILPPRPSQLQPEDRPIDILFQDEHLVVINKPQGLTVHPSATQTEGTLVHALLHHIKDLSGIGGELRPGIVHRIDKNTSGALVITKTDLAHQKLVEAFSKHDIEREYWALCYGTPGQKSGKIESLIGRSPTDRKKMSMKVTEGRRAVTHYSQREEYGRPPAAPFASWISATLETGRTHQVRVHLTGLGVSILGDPVYGSPTENQPKWKALPREIQELVRRLPGQALHARVLGFAHPVTGRKLRFEAEPPAIFADLHSALKKYS